VAGAIDGKLETGWRCALTGQRHIASLRPRNLELPNGMTLSSRWTSVTRASYTTSALPPFGHELQAARALDAGIPEAIIRF